MTIRSGIWLAEMAGLAVEQHAVLVCQRQAAAGMARGKAQGAGRRAQHHHPLAWRLEQLGLVPALAEIAPKPRIARVEADRLSPLRRHLAELDEDHRARDACRRVVLRNL